MKNNDEAIILVLREIAARPEDFGKSPEELNSIVTHVSAVLLMSESHSANLAHRMVDDVIRKLCGFGIKARTIAVRLGDENIDHPRHSSFKVFSERCNRFIDELAAILSTHKDDTQFTPENQKLLEEDPISLLRQMAIRPRLFGETVGEVSGWVTGMCSMLVMLKSDSSTLDFKPVWRLMHEVRGSVDRDETSHATLADDWNAFTVNCNNFIDKLEDFLKELGDDEHWATPAPTQ